MTTKDADVVDAFEVLAPTAIESLTRGEIDIQVATAKRYPRSLSAFRARALEMATLDQDTAESCIYALPRDGKTVEGPSARLAEILASAYGHMRIEGRPVGDDGKFLTARGTAWDIQQNVLIAFETKRRITDKHGRRYKDDMIGVTANAATSIAIRNAVLKVIPKAFWGPIYDACRKTAVGDAGTLANRRAAMLDYFLKFGATNDRVFAMLGVQGIDDVTLEHLVTLKGLATAIKDGDTTVDDAFTATDPPRVQRQSETAGRGSDRRTVDPPVRQMASLGLVAIDAEAGRGYVAVCDDGSKVQVSSSSDAMELEKFIGTSHRLTMTCVETPTGLQLKTFSIAE
jgi:hypothetical protein